MNQAYLSQLPLATLAFQYAQMSKGKTRQADACDDVNEYWRAIAKQQMGDAFAADLLADVEQFQTQGLDKISINDKALLIKKYNHYPSAYAEEVVGWLEERYRFDPACLTG